MNSYRTIVSSLLLVSGLGFVAAPAFAASSGCGPAGGRGEFFEHRTERMAQHHKKLHESLKLTPEQEGAWKKLMDAEQPMGKMEKRNSEDWSKLTTPERADKMLERMKAHQALQVDHVAALKEFYAVLTPEQKKTFDDFHAMQHRGMRGKSMNRASGADKATAKP